MLTTVNHSATRTATPGPSRQQETQDDTQSPDTTTRPSKAEQNSEQEELEDGHIMIGTTAWPLGESHNKLKIPNPHRDMLRAARKQFDILLRQISDVDNKPSALKHTLRKKWEKIRLAAENNSLNALEENGKPVIITKQVRFYKEGHNYE